MRFATGCPRTRDAFTSEDRHRVRRKLVNLFVDLERRRRPSRRVHGAELTGLELLDRRILPAVTATFSAAAGLLRVLGDEQDNTIVVSRDAGGTILVNNGAVAIQGGVPTVANTHMIFMIGVGGNDNLSLDETNGALPAASLFGGDGNDILIGGSGDDFVDGGAGNDTVFLGAGDDTFQWNPGDGSDTVDGQGGTDTMVFNGSDAAENYRYLGQRQSRPVHPRRRQRRDGPRRRRGRSTSTPSAAPTPSPSTTSPQPTLSAVNLDLNGTAGTGDGQADSVIVNGTDGDDTIQILAVGDGIERHRRGPVSPGEHHRRGGDERRPDGQRPRR